MARWRRSPLRFGNGIILAGPLGDPATPRPLADETFMAESQPPTADETGAKNFSKTLTVAVPVKHRNYCRCYSLAASIALVNSAARYCVDAARNRAGKRRLAAALTCRLRNKNQLADRLPRFHEAMGLGSLSQRVGFPDQHL